MGLREMAGVAAVLGGLAWTAAPWWGGPPLWWSGLALLVLACLTLGAGLVSSNARLRLVVAPAFLTLVGCVWFLLRGPSNARWVDLVTGVVALGAGVALLRQGRRERRAAAARARHAGRGMARHAA